VLDPSALRKIRVFSKEVMLQIFRQWGLGVEFSDCKKLAGKRVVMRELDVIQIDDGNR